MLQLAIIDNIEQFVDIDYPSSASKDDDHVCTYAKEVLSLGLLFMEFKDSIREVDGDRTIRCRRYYPPLFKSADRKNYSVEAFNLLFEYEYAMTERMKQQLTWERTVNVCNAPIQ